MTTKESTHSRFRRIAAIVVAALMYWGLQLAHADTSREWPTYGGQPSGTQYSILDQINLSNVEDLEVAWTYNTGEISDGTEGIDATVYQVTPIFANDLVYLCTPFNKIVALNPDNGNKVWVYDPKKPLSGAFYSAHNCRGVSYWQAESSEERAAFCGKRVFQTIQTGQLVAVDADSGKICKDFGKQGQIDLNALDNKGSGEIYSTSPPAIYKVVVITGGSIYDNKFGDAIDGIVRGFNIRTGEEVWNWNPIPDHLSDKVGAANAWAPIAIDQNNGWVVIPTGSPSYDLFGKYRKDPIPDANAVVVLNALTGEKIWSYQTVHHDLWDYDLSSMPTLVEVERNGKKVEAVLQATKTGMIFLLDRHTGKPLFDVEERPVPQTDVPGEYTSPTQPFPVLPEPVTSINLTTEDGWGLLFSDESNCEAQLANLRNEGIFTPPSLKGSILHPSFLGGTNWGGIAFDNDSGVAIVNSSNLVASVTLVPRDEYKEEVHRPKGYSHYEMRGSEYVGIRGVLRSFLPGEPPCNPPPWGSLTALDMNTGKTKWKIPFGQLDLFGPIKSPESWGAPNMGGPIITKGGLIFIGASPDKAIRAYDVKTGELVWKSKLPAPATATPMTYESKGKQFVVIAAGGHLGFGTVQSDSIVAFALPSKD